MLIKILFAISLLAATTTADFSSKNLILNNKNCDPCTPPTAATPPITVAPPTPPITPPAPVPGPCPPTPCNNCPKPDCSMVPNGTTFPYANHCKLYYQCQNGSAVVVACPNGYWYDRAITKCMLCAQVLNCEAKTD